MVFLIKGLWKAKLGHNAVKRKKSVGERAFLPGKINGLSPMAKWQWGYPEIGGRPAKRFRKKDMTG